MKKLNENYSKFITTSLTNCKFRFIEQTCIDYNIEMKPCQNVQQFLDKVDEFKDTIGKPLSFSDISDDLDKTYAHIFEQKDMIKGTVENFKRLVFKIAV